MNCFWPVNQIGSRPQLPLTTGKQNRVLLTRRKKLKDTRKKNLVLNACSHVIFKVDVHVLSSLDDFIFVVSPIVTQFSSLDHFDGSRGFGPSPWGVESA